MIAAAGLGYYRQPLLDRRPTLERLADQRRRVRRLHLGEEPEPTHLHAEDRRPGLRRHVRTPQEGPVTTDGDHEVDDVSASVEIGARDPVFLQRGTEGPGSVHRRRSPFMDHEAHRGHRRSAFPSPTAASTSIAAGGDPETRCTGNSTLPAGPRQWRGHHVHRFERQRARGRHHLRESASPHVRVADDAATPHLRSPRFELRLHQDDEGRFRGRHASQSGQRQPQRDEGEICHHDGGEERKHRRREVAHVRPLHHRHPRIHPEAPGQLTVPNVDRDHARRAALQETVREPAC
jgi:hypothetical protein